MFYVGLYNYKEYNYKHDFGGSATIYKRAILEHIKTCIWGGGIGGHREFMGGMCPQPPVYSYAPARFRLIQ